VEQVRRSFDDPDHRAPGGESLREAQERGLAAVAAISQCGHRLPAIATHGNLLAGMLARADPSFGFSGWQALQNPDLFLGTCRDGDLVAFARVAPPR